MENQFQKSGKEYQTMTTIIIKEYRMKSKCGSACFVHTQQLSMQEYSARNTMVLKRSIQHIPHLKILQPTPLGQVSIENQLPLLS